MPLPYPLQAHAHTVSKWLVRLGVNPVVHRRLMEDGRLFGLFFAALRSRVQLTQELETFLERALPTGEIQIDEAAFEAWKKGEGNPVAGRVSSAYLESLFLGMRLHQRLRRQPDIWLNAMNLLQATWQAENPVTAPDRLELAVMMDRMLLTARMEGRPDQEIEEMFRRFQAAHQDLEVAAPETPTLPMHLRDPHLALPKPVDTWFSANLDVLHWLVALTDLEKQMLELAFIMRGDEAVRSLLEALQGQVLEWPDLLACLHDVPRETIESVTAPESVLMRSGLISFDPETRQVFPMSDFWCGWLGGTHTSLAEMFKRLVQPLVAKPNAGALGRIAPEDQAIVLDLFSRDRDMLSPGGLNVLFYGPRSIDKVGVVLALTQKLNQVPFTLASNIPEREWGTVTYLVQRYLRLTAPKAVLVLTAADRVLTRTRRGRKDFVFFSVEMDDDVQDTQADIALLENNPAKTIWLVNAPENLSEDNLGRFLYVSEVRTASRAERLAEIETVLKELDISPALKKELSQHLQLSEQQLKSAHRLVQELKEEGPCMWVPPGLTPFSQEHRDALVRRVIEQSQKAMARQAREHLRQPITTYSLDLLNVSGSFSVSQIIQSLRQRQHGALCFYGLPGTGKTQLAEYIAVQLDRPILMRRASELINKFIGESEKNIRNMFKEAAEEDAVLFLDEADSFLMDRTRAMHSWETSAVNELLQSMERHRGVFICATNLFDVLDRAALRRFTFKLQFNSLTEDQRWQMLCTEARLDPTTLAPTEVEAIRQRLLLMYELTPGDFATVQRKVELLNAPLTLDQWLQELEQEAEFKRQSERHQRIGRVS